MLTKYDEDPDFLQSDVDIAKEEDDMLYNHNVSDGIEIGPNMNEAGHKREMMLIEELENNNAVDDLEYPLSKELVLDCSLE